MKKFSIVIAGGGSTYTPGIVMMLPQITTTNPAPAERRTSRTFSVKPSGAPVSLALRP